MYTRRALLRAAAALAAGLAALCAVSFAQSVLRSWPALAGLDGGAPLAGPVTPPGLGWLGVGCWLAFVGYVATARVTMGPAAAACWAGAAPAACVAVAAAASRLLPQLGSSTLAPAGLAGLAVTAAFGWRVWSWLAPPLAGLPSPLAGQVWWAQVKFEDSTRSKDRPVLVLAVRARTATVLTCTSQDRSGVPGYLPVPAQVFGHSRSFLRTDRTLTVPLVAFRRLQARAPQALLDEPAVRARR